MSPPPIDDETVRKLVTEPRWKTLVRVEEPPGSIVNWAQRLLPQPPALVPIDGAPPGMPLTSQATL